MFTLKFFRHGNEKTVICGPHYSVCESYPVTHVYVYPSFKDDQCKVFELELSPNTSGQDVYYEVFIENETGKTIDRYRALSGNPPSRPASPDGVGI